MDGDVGRGQRPSGDALVGVDSIEWGALCHAYGAADDVPRWLRAVADPQESQAAVHELSFRIYHQGGMVYSAASAALPFLVTLAADPKVVSRVALIELIGDLARAGRKAKSRWVDEAWPTAWAQALPQLLALLDDTDPDVRRRVGFPLAQAVDGADAVWRAVRQRWDVEDDRVVRVGLVAVVGQLLRNGTGWGQTGARRWLVELFNSSDAVRRLAVAVALRRSGTRDVGIVCPSGTGPADVSLPEHALAALRQADLRAWAHAWCGNDDPKWMIGWVDRQWGEDPRGRTVLAAGLLDHPDMAYRAGALRAAAEITSRWRSPTAALLPQVAKRLADPEPDNRAFAAYLLAAYGSPASVYADQLADLRADIYLPSSDIAVFALTRIGDVRCVEPLLDRLTRPRLGFPLNNHRGGGWWIRPPGIEDVLGAVPQYAGNLLPAVRARLRAATSLDERRTFARVLARWGTASAPALAELDRLLDTDAAVWALHALAAIGPQAWQAIPVARLQSLTANDQLIAFDRKTVVEAYWRLTGDPQPALDLLLPQLHHRHHREAALDFLAELGRPAHRYVDRVRAVLRDEEHMVPLVSAATALWRLTGDPTESVATLMNAIRPLTVGGRVSRFTLRVITTLGEIGPAAADAAPLLRLAVAGDRRRVGPGQWESIREDEEFQRLTAVALGQILAG